MTSPQRTVLHAARGACSRISLVALEACGVDYALRRLDLAAGEQRAPAFRALDARGKVPLLETAQGTLAETLGIVAWLDASHPQAGLLPPANDAWARAQAVSRLAWSNASLHPLIYRARMPQRIHPDEATHAAVRRAAFGELGAQFDNAEATLADGRAWLCGERWNIGDTAFWWIWTRAVDSGLDPTPWPACAALAARAAELPATRRALAREAAGA